MSLLQFDELVFVYVNLKALGVGEFFVLVGW